MEIVCGYCGKPVEQLRGITYVHLTNDDYFACGHDAEPMLDTALGIGETAVELAKLYVQAVEGIR